MTAATTAAQAVERANLWTVKAQPIGRALLALAVTERDLLESCDAATWDEVRPALADHEYRLRRILDDMRDAAIDAVLPAMPEPEEEAAWDKYEAISDQVHAETITIPALIRQMEEEA